MSSHSSCTAVTPARCSHPGLEYAASVNDRRPRMFWKSARNACESRRPRRPVSDICPATRTVPDRERIRLVQEKLLNEQNRDVKLEVAVGLLPEAMPLVLGGEVPGGHAVRPDGRDHLLGFRVG